jgi:hypothetical protein
MFSPACLFELAYRLRYCCRDNYSPAHSGGLVRIFVWQSPAVRLRLPPSATCALDDSVNRAGIRRWERVCRCARLALSRYRNNGDMAWAALAA